MMLLLLTLAIAIVPNTDIAAERVALIEVNHYYDENGKHVLDQVIFYHWTGEQFEVIAWRLLKKQGQRPVQDFQRGDWFATWQDGDTLRLIRAGGFVETWTQYDPEVWARDRLPSDERRGLIKGRLGR